MQIFYWVWSPVSFCNYETHEMIVFTCICNGAREALLCLGEGGGSATDECNSLYMHSALLFILKNRIS